MRWFLVGRAFLLGTSVAGVHGQGHLHLGLVLSGWAAIFPIRRMAAPSSWGNLRVMALGITLPWVLHGQEVETAKAR